MQTDIVLTLTGHDRVGIVETVTKLLVQRGGNVQSSRMARLGGEFAMLMLVSLPETAFAGLEQDFQALRAEGYHILLLPTEDKHAETYKGWLPYQIEVLGADHEGIIHEIARHLAAQGINIETLDTSVTRAPMSGTPLFSMQAVVLVPPHIPFSQWGATLEELGDRLNVNIGVGLVKGQ
ncbi:MAG: transcriptional regulator [Anaerolineae bacterium]|nr:MAG: transcriptional regulator [Anaerolineae bacterium]